MGWFSNAAPQSNDHRSMIMPMLRVAFVGAEFQIELQHKKVSKND